MAERQEIVHRQLFRSRGVSMAAEIERKQGASNVNVARGGARSRHEPPSVDSGAKDRISTRSATLKRPTRALRDLAPALATSVLPPRLGKRCHTSDRRLAPD